MNKVSEKIMGICGGLSLFLFLLWVVVLLPTLIIYSTSPNPPAYFVIFSIITFSLMGIAIVVGGITALIGVIRR